MSKHVSKKHVQTHAHADANTSLYRCLYINQHTRLLHTIYAHAYAPRAGAHASTRVYAHAHANVDMHMSTHKSIRTSIHTSMRTSMHISYTGITRVPRRCSYGPSALSRHRRRHGHCAGMDVPVLKMTASAQARSYAVPACPADNYIGHNYMGP